MIPNFQSFVEGIPISLLCTSKCQHSYIEGEHRRHHTCETSAWHQYHCAHISMLTLALSRSVALHSHRHGCEIFLIGPVLSSHLFRPH